MTPAIRNAKKAGINYRILEYSHDHRTTSYGEEASEKLGFPSNKVFKTLVVEVDLSFLAICVIPVCRLLDLKQAAKALGGKKLQWRTERRLSAQPVMFLAESARLVRKKSLKPSLTNQPWSMTPFWSVLVAGGLKSFLPPWTLPNLPGQALWRLQNLIHSFQIKALA